MESFTRYYNVHDDDDDDDISLTCVATRVERHFRSKLTKKVLKGGFDKEEKKGKIVFFFFLGYKNNKRGCDLKRFASFGEDRRGRFSPPFA